MGSTALWMNPVLGGSSSSRMAGARPIVGHGLALGPGPQEHGPVATSSVPLASGRPAHPEPWWERVRLAVARHPLLADTVLAAVLLALSIAWAVHSGTLGAGSAAFQVALVSPLAFRRLYPSTVFCLVALVALVQWTVSVPLVADAALLVALYTLAAHTHRGRTALGALVLEVGVVMATVRWVPTGNGVESFVFLSGLVAASALAGAVWRTWRAYAGSLRERAARLELERDQQAAIAASAERARIAREMHDVVAHSVSIMITLADGATVVGRSNPARAVEAMEEVSDVGRQALSDMRRLVGVLRTDDHDGLGPQPGLADLESLAARIQATGPKVTVERSGAPFPLGAGVELTLFRIAQECLTNVVAHAHEPSAVTVRLELRRPRVTLTVVDDGRPVPEADIAGAVGGHGIPGMRERVTLYGGTLRAGPRPGGGWEVTATLTIDEGGTPR